jgi:hypothetical protein
MVTIEERRTRYQELRRRGISLPRLTDEQLAAPTPPPSLVDHPWLAYLYDRPTERTFSGHVLALGPVQAAWDSSDRFVTGQLALQAEREAAARAEQAARIKADNDQRQTDANRLKDELRDRFLGLPGTTPEEFESQYPQLLADHRQRQLHEIERTDQAARADMARLVRSAL